MSGGPYGRRGVLSDFEGGGVPKGYNRTDPSQVIEAMPGSFVPLAMFFQIFNLKQFIFLKMWGEVVILKNSLISHFQ